MKVKMLLKYSDQIVFLNLIQSGKKGPMRCMGPFILVRRFWTREEGFGLFASFG